MTSIHYQAAAVEAGCQAGITHCNRADQSQLVCAPVTFTTQSMVAKILPLTKCAKIPLENTKYSYKAL